VALDAFALRTDRHGDPLPPGAVARLGTMRFRHGNGMSVAFSADSESLLTFGADRTLRSWDPHSGRLLREQRLPPGAHVQAAVLSPDGRLLAFHDSDAPDAFYLWDVARNQLRHRLALGERWGQRAAFSPEGKLLALGVANGEVRRWDWRADRVARRWRAGESSLLSLAFSPDGKALATGHLEGPIRLWDAGTGKERNVPAGHTQSVSKVVYLPGGKTLATLSPDNTIRFWDLTSGKELRSIGGLWNRGQAVAFSPDGKLVVSLKRGGDVCAWHTDSAREAWTLPSAGPRARPWGLAFRPDGKVLAVGHNDGLVRLWDVAKREVERELRGPRAAVSGLAFSPDGKTLAGYEAPTTLFLWDLAGGKGVRRVTTSHPGDPDLVFSPDGRLLALADGGDVRLVEVDTGQPRGFLRGHPNGTTGLAFSPEGRTLATSGGADQGVRFTDVATGEEFHARHHPGGATAVTWRPDGKALAVGGADTLVRVWDPAKLLPAKRAREPVKWPEAELDRLWAGLGSDEGPKAGESMRRLAMAPAQAVTLLRARGALLSGVGKRPEDWIKDLDSDDFVTREKASDALEKLGRAAEPALRKALEESPSAEVRRRVQRLLKGLDRGAGPAPAAVAPASRELAAARAVELLERLGTPEAKKLLAEWGKEKSSTLSREAKAALRRLGRVP
jgi:WD40 repeat protein